MKVIGIQSSPNLDGLTCQLVHAALEGAESGGAEIKLIHLNKLRIESCKAHNRGWETCRNMGKCMINDDSQSLREKINGADALVFSTPVYFGDISESAKSFLDKSAGVLCWSAGLPDFSRPILINQKDFLLTNQIRALRNLLYRQMAQVQNL